MAARRKARFRAAQNLVNIVGDAPKQFSAIELARNANVTAEEAAKEWAANVVAGINIIPSGTWGVNRAQEAGCTYCAGG
jgi:hypothetical protein